MIPQMKKTDTWSTIVMPLQQNNTHTTPKTEESNQSNMIVNQQGKDNNIAPISYNKNSPTIQAKVIGTNNHQNLQHKEEAAHSTHPTKNPAQKPFKSIVDETTMIGCKVKINRRNKENNIHKTRLRKQLQNGNFLQNYFEWNKVEGTSVELTTFKLIDPTIMIVNGATSQSTTIPSTTTTEYLKGCSIGQSWESNMMNQGVVTAEKKRLDSPADNFQM